MNHTNKTLKLQEIQNAQGYIVTGSFERLPIGYVFEGMDNDPELQFPHVCIATATRQEAVSQARRFGLNKPSSPFYHKVKAE